VPTSDVDARVEVRDVAGRLGAARKELSYGAFQHVKLQHC
jgi:hypothetical protein